MQFYRDAAEFIGPSQKKGSLQSRIFHASKHGGMRSDPKHVYAVVSSTLKFKPFLVEIIQKSKLLVLEKKKKIPENVALLLVHDFLLTKSGRIQSKQHPWKEAIVRNKTRLHAELTKLLLKNHVKSLDELVEDDETPVRWFRVNTMKTTFEQLLKEFGHLKQVKSINGLEKGMIYHDEYIPNLFGVHPREKITSSDAYKKGRIIIQDRASCFPAFILNPTPGVDKVIDATAAPGNKTTHLACILDGTPRSVIAFEKDNYRVKTLHYMCDKAGGLDCISIQHGDFTNTNPDDYPEITGMLVDPSCSGSGIFGRAFEENDNDEKETYSEERLEGLSNFQFAIVKHAMMFPNLKKLVYSTCSIYPQEDERVVIRLLEDPEVKERGWHLRNRKDVIPMWPRRGDYKEFEGYPYPKAMAGGCVRTLPKKDGGIGFFAASFARDDGDATSIQVEEPEADGSDVSASESQSNDDSESEEYSDWDGFTS